MTVVTPAAPIRRLAARAAYAGLFIVALPVMLALWAVRLDTWVTLPTFDVPVLASGLGVAGAALMLAGMWTLWIDGGGLPASPFPPARLVTGGIYAVLPHPIYVGAVLTSFGVALSAQSPAGFWIVSPTLALAAAAFVIGFERDATRRRYGSVATPWLSLPGHGDEPPAFRQRAAIFVLVFLPWGIAYQAVEALGVPPDATIAYFDWETRLPVVPWTEALYAGTYILVLAAPLVAARSRDLRDFARGGLWATALILPLYLLVPLIAPPRPIHGEGFWQSVMRLERAFDEPVTAFPSFHVVWTCLAAALWSKTFPRWRPFFQACVVAIAASCVTTGMHAIVDVAGGFLAYIVVSKRRALWRRACDSAEWVANGWQEVSLGPVRFLVHGVFAAAGATFGVGLAVNLAGQEYSGWIVAMTAGAVVGAAAWGQLIEGSAVLLRPYGYFGSVIGVLAVAVSAALAGVDLWRVFTAFGVGATFAQAVGRLRCLMQGCCHGRESAAEIGIRYRHPRSRVVRLAALSATPLHATPVYSLVWMSVVGAVMLRLWALAVPLQFIAGSYFILTGLGRFVEEHYRGEPQTAIVGGLRLYQWLAIAFITGGAVVTTLGASPAPASGGLDGAFVPVLLGVAAVTYAAYGVDFPSSNRRFSRLV